MYLALPCLILGALYIIQKQVFQIPTGARLTIWLFISVSGELKVGIAVLQIQFVVRAGIKRVISDTKSGILLTQHAGHLLRSIDCEHFNFAHACVLRLMRPRN